MGRFVAGSLRSVGTEPAGSREVVFAVGESIAFSFETSEVSWHGFPKIDLPENRRDLSRRSIAVYFYTKSRPKEQTAPDHSTVYVPRPLPDKFRAGHKLSNEDAGELKIAVQRRDRQMKFLYEREKEFSLVIEGCHWRIGEHEKEIDRLQAIHSRAARRDREAGDAQPRTARGDRESEAETCRRAITGSSVPRRFDWGIC